METQTQRRPICSGSDPQVHGSFLHKVNVLLKTHLCLFLYLALYLVLVILILPATGEALLTDDCDFAVTVFQWLESGELRMSDFPSMTLIGHLSWGAAFAKCFGSSIVVLRASSMVMAWIGAIAIYRLASARGKTPSVAAFFSATYVFNPFTFFYAYTFNTDVAGCTMMIVFIAVADRWRESINLRKVSCLGVFFAACYLTRQTAAMPALLYMVMLLLSVLRRQTRPIDLIAYVTIGVTPVLLYFGWLKFFHGWPLGYEKSFLRLDILLNWKVVIAKLGIISMQIGLFTLPAVMVAKRSIKFEPKKALISGLVIGTVSLCLLTIDQLQPLRPYWSQEVVDIGFGKQPNVIGLEDRCKSGVLEFGSLRGARFDFVVVPLSVFSLWVWAELAFRQRHQWKAFQKFTTLGSSQSSVMICGGVLAGSIFLLLTIWDVFDRYSMPAITMSILLLAMGLIPRDVNLFRGILCLATAGLLGVLGTQDSICQSNAAWQMACQLEDRGVDPREIWVGHQYFGNHAYWPELQHHQMVSGMRLREIDPAERLRLLATPIYPTYRLSTRPDSSVPEDERMSLAFSSWIRHYEFFLVKHAPQSRR